MKRIKMSVVGTAGPEQPEPRRVRWYVWPLAIALLAWLATSLWTVSSASARHW